METEQLTVITADFYDKHSGDKAFDLYKRFRSSLVKTVEERKFDQIVEGNVFYDPRPGEAVITIKLVVKDPISASVKQANELLESSARAVDVQIVDSGDNTDTQASLYESDGMTLVPA